MSVDGGVSEFGQFQVITINRGARDGVEVGPRARDLPARRAVINAGGRRTDVIGGSLGGCSTAWM